MLFQGHRDVHDHGRHLHAPLPVLDPRVRSQFAQLLTGGDGISSWDNRLADLGSTMVSVLRYQSLENGPLMIFAVVGAVLFLFMVRT